MASVLKDGSLEAINELIDSKGLKKRYIATKMHVSDQYLSNILTGKSKLDADKLIAICKVIGVDYNIFIK